MVNAIDLYYLGTGITQHQQVKKVHTIRQQPSNRGFPITPNNDTDYCGMIAWGVIVIGALSFFYQLINHEGISKAITVIGRMILLALIIIAPIVIGLAIHQMMKRNQIFRTKPRFQTNQDKEKIARRLRR